MISGLSPNAFILAAGHGKRLRPHTLETPKPLIKVDGRPMIDQALEKLAAIGVTDCVVNTHYLAEKLQAHLQNRNAAPRIILSHEPDLLDTGGGIKNAIHHFAQPFFVLSGDSVWEEPVDQPALGFLAAHWEPEKMDILMLLQPVKTMVLTAGIGDYDLDDEGRAVRAPDQSGQYMFTSIRINAPEIFADAPDGPFSYLDLLDAAQKKGRLFGVVNPGLWHHISTPDDLDAVNAVLKAAS